MAAQGSYVPSSGNMVAGAIPEQRFNGAGSALQDVFDLPDGASEFAREVVGKTDVGFGWFGAASEPTTVSERVRPPMADVGAGGYLTQAPLQSLEQEPVLPDALERSGSRLMLRSHCRGAPVEPGSAVGGAVESVAHTELFGRSLVSAGAPIPGVDTNAGTEHPNVSFLARFLDAADRLGRKIPHCYENPVDNVLIDLNEHVNPIYHALGMVPNHVTGLSALFGIASVYALAHGSYVASGVLYAVSYYFDVADGNYARAYGMVSKFGDLLDHVKDVLVVAGLYAVILFKLDVPVAFKVLFFAVQALMVAGMFVHLGCQERYYDDLKKKKDGAGAVSESASLSGLRAMCLLDPESKMPITRWVGCGTYMVVTAAWLIAAKWWVR